MQPKVQLCVIWINYKEFELNYINAVDQQYRTKSTTPSRSRNLLFRLFIFTTHSP